MQTNPARPSRLFTTLAFATAFLTVGLIVFGAIVRVTDSGFGCGNQWQLCNGTIFPPLDNLTAWIEWLHRLFAALIGAFGIATLVVAIRAYRGGRIQRLPLVATVAAAILFFVQSILGAIVVVLDLPPTSVTLHLGTAMLLLAALLIAAIASVYRPAERPDASDRVTALAYVTTALSFVIILTGALVRGSGATLACVDWPLCNGTVFPFEQGQLAIIHMLHRFAVAALGLSLLLLVGYAFSLRPTGNARRYALLALFAYLAQAGIGAAYVLTAAAPLWGALHVLFAALTWGSLVGLSLVETLNSRDKGGETEGTWQRQTSDPVRN